MARAPRGTACLEADMRVLAFFEAACYIATFASGARLLAENIPVQRERTVQRHGHIAKNVALPITSIAIHIRLLASPPAALRRHAIGSIARQSPSFVFPCHSCFFFTRTYHPCHSTMSFPSSPTLLNRVWQVYQADEYLMLPLNHEAPQRHIRGASRHFRLRLCSFLSLLYFFSAVFSY